MWGRTGEAPPECLARTERGAGVGQAHQPARHESRARARARQGTFRVRRIPGLWDDAHDDAHDAVRRARIQVPAPFPTSSTFLLYVAGELNHMGLFLLP